MPDTKTVRLRPGRPNEEAIDSRMNRRRRNCYKPFEQIIAEHGPSILKICRAIVGPCDAEDAWSETFLSAMRAYPNLRPGSNIKAWLITIAKRKAIDQHRAQSHATVSLDDAPEIATNDPHPIEEYDALWSALRALPTKQREAIAYHYIAEMPYSQVAEILGNTEAAARRAAADGVKRLRETYREEY